MFQLFSNKHDYFVPLLFRNVVAPLIARPGKLFSNFWGAIASNGFYARSDDYQLIVESKRRSVMACIGTVGGKRRSVMACIGTVGGKRRSVMACIGTVGGKRRSVMVQ